MAYALLNDITTFVPKWRVAGDTQPSASEVEDYLDRLSARIDGIAAAQGYAISITGTQSLDVVKSICLVGTAWYIGRTLFPNGGVEAVDDYRREFEQMMLELTTGTLVLPDASRDSESPTSVITSTTDPAVASAMVPFFTRGMVF